MDRADHEARAVDEGPHYQQATFLNEVLVFVEGRGHEGATWGEVAEATGRHHGIVSGCLSVLHRRGLLIRVKPRRGRSKVYLAKDLEGLYEDEGFGRREHECPRCGHRH